MLSNQNITFDISGSIIVSYQAFAKRIMGSSEKLCLKWGDFQSNISNSFGNMRHDFDFSDVTLVCDGNKNIEAHKVVLAASSNFFSNILKKSKHPHPLLYMKGIQTSQLNDVVDFIYHGEVNIHQEDLVDFLALAENLQLKGLNSPIEEMQDKPRNEGKEKPLVHKRNGQSKKEIVNEIKKEINMVENYYDEEVTKNLTSTAIDSVDTKLFKANTNYEELDETINSMMEKLETGKYACKVCGKVDNQDKAHMRNHIEGKHISGISHTCNICEKSYRSRNAIASHMSKEHRA